MLPDGPKLKTVYSKWARATNNGALCLKIYFFGGRISDFCCKLAVNPVDLIDYAD